MTEQKCLHCGNVYVFHIAIRAKYFGHLLFCSEQCADEHNAKLDQFREDFEKCPDEDHCWCSNIRSKFEKEIFHLLKKHGWEVHNSGWPDFLVHDGFKRPMFLEVKDDGDSVRPNQQAVHDLLRRHGISVKVITRGNVLDFERSIERRHTRNKLRDIISETPFSGDPFSAMDALDKVGGV